MDKDKDIVNDRITEQIDGTADALKEGVVVGSEGGLYKVRLTDGQTLFCKPRGRFRHERLRLLVGDRVFTLTDAQGNAVIDRVAERKNALIRPPIANLDRLFIVVSAAAPDPIFLNIDKLTVIAAQNDIETVIVVTKCDLDAESADRIARIYRNAGFEVFVTGEGDREGLAALGDYIERTCLDGISTFAGASGVGKSTLFNRLFPTLKRETREVSARIGRGRHTTRTVDLFAGADLFGKSGGYIADTPGFSLLDFESFDFCTLEDLPDTFPEFQPLLGTCRYTKCTHRKEEGCAILREMREGRIGETRHDSYVQLYEQLKNKPVYTK